MYYIIYFNFFRGLGEIFDQKKKKRWNIIFYLKSEKNKLGGC